MLKVYLCGRGLPDNSQMEHVRLDAERCRIGHQAIRNWQFKSEIRLEELMRLRPSPLHLKMTIDFAQRFQAHKSGKKAF